MSALTVHTRNRRITRLRDHVARALEAFPDGVDYAYEVHYPDGHVERGVLHSERHHRHFE